MYYVYALLRANGTLYIGRTSDLKRRICEHKAGKTRSTRATKPKLIYYEAYIGQRDSISREVFLKTGDGRQELKKQLKQTLMALSSNG